MNNFVQISRSLMQLWWYKDVSLRLVMMHLIFTANHAAVQMPGVVVKRGETLTSRAKMRAEIGITDKVLRRCLKQLEMAGEVAKMSINKTSRMGTIITICKYDTYVGVSPSTEYVVDQVKGQDRAKIGTKMGAKKNKPQISNNQYDKRMDKGVKGQDRAKIGHTNNNIEVRNILSKDKNITHFVVGALAREEGQEVEVSKKQEIENLEKKFFGQEQRGAFEQLCMSLSCTPDEFRKIAKEIFAEWLLTDEPVKGSYNAASKHLIATARIKLAEKRRAAARTPKTTRTKEQWREDMANHIQNTYFSQYLNDNGTN